MSVCVKFTLSQYNEKSHFFRSVSALFCCSFVLLSREKYCLSAVVFDLDGFRSEQILDEVVAHDVADEGDRGNPTSGHEVVLGLQRLLEPLRHPYRHEIVVFTWDHFRMKDGISFWMVVRPVVVISYVFFNCF